MKRTVRIGATLLVTGLLGHAPAYAVDVSWSGFGSAVVGKAFDQQDLPSGAESEYLAVPTLQGKSSATYEDFFTFRPDTNLGLQATAYLGEGFKTVAQLTSKGGNNFAVEAEWLYASYDFTDKFTGTIGRQRAPFYFYSDYIDVAFAYHWLRQPLDLYGEGIAIYEGVSGFYKDYAGDWDYEIQGYFGDGANETSTFGDVQLTEFGGLLANLTQGAWRFRVSATHADGWLRDYVAGPPQVGMTKDEPVHFMFYSGGVGYDDGEYFALAEYTLLEADEFAQSGITGATVDKRESWMFSMGIRLNAFTPHITLSERDIDLTGDGIAPFANEVISTRTMNVGVRYDFHGNAALKLDLTKVADESTDFVQTALGKSREVTVIAAGVDFVF